MWYTDAMSSLDDLFRHPDPGHGSLLGDLACIAWVSLKIFCIGAAVILGAPVLGLLVITLIH